MIEIIYRPDERTITVDGHAKSGPYGNDIVCAAVSSLTYALEATSIVHPLYNAEIKRYSSITHFYCKMGWLGRKALWAVADGLKLIADNYKEYVSFEERRRDD